MVRSAWMLKKGMKSKLLSKPKDKLFMWIKDDEERYGHLTV